MARKAFQDLFLNTSNRLYYPRNSSRSRILRHILTSTASPIQHVLVGLHDRFESFGLDVQGVIAGYIDYCSWTMGFQGWWTREI
jgi:ADP-heptose:LPS heptosyltransferase